MAYSSGFSKKFSRAQLLLFAAHLALFASACSTGPRSPDPAISDDKSDSSQPQNESRKFTPGGPGAPFAIAPGYLVSIHSAQDKNISGKYRVEFDGTLKLPYKVNVQAQGLTIAELQERLSESYASFFKVIPTFKVDIAEKMYAIRVNGLVEKPGNFLVKENASLDEVIASAGGLQKGEGKSSLAQFVRIEQPTGNTVTIKLADYYSGVARNAVPRWKGGDLVFLQSERGDTGAPSDYTGNEIQLLGEVRNPGEYRFKEGADAFYYLGKAGGPTERANLSKVQLIRGSSHNRDTDEYEIEDVPKLRAGDQLIVHPERPTRLERTASLMATLLSVVNTVFLAILLF